MRFNRQVSAGGLVALAVCAAVLVAGGWARGAAAGGGDKSLQRAEKALRGGEFEAAEKLFREIVAKDKGDARARLGLSLALLKQRKHQDAFDHAARVIASDPLSHRAHSLLGSALLGAGEFRLSVEEFRTALGLKSDDAMAIAGLAMVDFYENRLQASLAGLRRAAVISPDEPDYQFNLGQIAARSERYAEAAEAYERFLRVAPLNDADRRARIRGLIDFLRYLGTQNELMQTGGPARSVVPFELVNNRPIVRVRVNNSKETLRFVVDTGAGMCVIAAGAAERLGLRAVARGGMARAIGGRFEIVYGFLQSMQIGEARVSNVPVYIRHFERTQESVDGYIGLSLVAKYLTTVDYGAREMLLLRGDAVPKYDPERPPPGAEVPIRVTSSGFWSGEIRLDEVERAANFIIDTGATTSVVSQAFADREALARFARPTRIRVYGAAGLTENVQTLLLPRVHLGPHAHQNVSAAVLDMEPINETAGFEQTGIVGGNLLRHYRVTFDFPRSVVRLEPLASAPKEERTAAPPVVTSQP